MKENKMIDIYKKLTVKEDKIIIAGPCAIESYDQLLKTAQPCSARILNKYSEELKQKIKYYNGKHFSLIG